MSWQSYIDDQLLAAGFMYGAIYGFDGAKWASSEGYEVQVAEATKLAKLLQGSDLSSIAADGFFVAGQ